jgi:hypothetical protein
VNPPESIFPAPTTFQTGFPLISIVRPRTIAVARAVATVNKLIARNVFSGQPQSFVDMLLSLTQAADAAKRTTYVAVQV